MSAVALIDDIARLGMKYLPEIANTADNINFGSSFNTGRKLARAGRLSRLDAEKAIDVTNDLKPFLREGTVIDELPATFIDDVTNDAINRAKEFRTIAEANGYDMNALRMGEAIGALQNTAGRTGTALGKVMNHPAAVPLMFLPDIYYMTTMISNPVGNLPQPQGQQYY
jgi:hypothetical protein